MGSGQWVTGGRSYQSDLGVFETDKQPLLCGVQSASSFQSHMHYTVGKVMEFPNRKINIHKQLFWSLLTTCARGTRDGLREPLANQDWGLSAFNFIC